MKGFFSRFGILKLISVILLFVLIYLQIILWIGDGSIAEVWRLKNAIALLEEKNDVLAQRNKKLLDEVDNLKNGLELVEFRARKDLGMIKEGEIFYRVIKPKGSAELVWLARLLFRIALNKSNALIFKRVKFE